MSFARKRFWTTAEVAAEEGGHAVRLDGRPVRTPAGRPFRAPTRAAAQAAAAEWAAVEGEVNPAAMPVTKAVNVVVDRVLEAHAEVAEATAAYAGADLLCYRADWPEALVARQEAGWDPVLDWLEQAHRAPLVRVQGVMHAPQPARSLAALAGATAAHDAWELTALHEMTTLSGSLGLALAVSAGRLEVEEAWGLSRIDEDFQAEQWGEDDGAAALAAHQRAAFHAAARFLALVRDRDGDGGDDGEGGGGHGDQSGGESG